jgi:hypothetical protein
LFLFLLLLVLLVLVLEVVLVVLVVLLAPVRGTPGALGLPAALPAAWRAPFCPRASPPAALPIGFPLRDFFRSPSLIAPVPSASSISTTSPLPPLHRGQH